MSDIKTEEKKNSPESIADREELPTCCTMATKDEECHGNSWVEQQQKTDANQEQPRKKQKSKGKLIRSVAVCDESLPAESSNKGFEETGTPTGDNAISSECEEEEQGRRNGCSRVKKASLSKELSLEYTDSTGIDLEDFLITTLKSSPRDRLMLLKLEQDMIDFMMDNCSYRKFPQMSSYHRMLVHRVAAYFGLEHNVDHSGKAVIINKTSNSRIPEQRFAEHAQEEKTEERKSILKRESSLEKEETQRASLLKEQKKSKSIEEREEEYQRVRDRIFSQDCPTQSVYIETRGPEECSSIHNETQRKRQLFRASREGSGHLSSSRQSSVELECAWSEPRPWSSTDSEGSTWTSKTTHSHSDSFCKAEPLPNNSSAYILVPVESSILPGSILLNPHTGQPYLNPDGSPAVYNPPGSQQPVTHQLNTMQSQAPPTPHQQLPMASHSLPQVQYSSVTYLPPQQAITVSSSQLYPPEQSVSMHKIVSKAFHNNRFYIFVYDVSLYKCITDDVQCKKDLEQSLLFSPQREDLSSQFSHMTLNRQSSGDLSDVPTYCLHRAAPSHNYAQPEHNYAPPFSADSYISSEMAVLPTQTCGQQSAQASIYSYPGQCPNTSHTQQCGPAGYSTQTGYGGLIANQQAFPSMVGPQVLPQTQQSIMGSYPPTSSYQMEPQLQSYPSALVSRYSGQAQNAAPPTGRSVFCHPLPSSPPPTVSILGVTCQSSSCRNTCIRSQNQCWY
ncbi:cAMP-regulated phosphoprotein 21 isoform X2 [Electrophorus electricus]|uniref:cAMP-regulated phosphoprotein 21 isoform X2 n=1 Tax=Electrophorus electricus TaxID=8005 RepID=UPI0015D0C6C1|nr:cAMP-regulated phosphoprotein 21 isoform X2 [Electrophorus electricus]